MSNNQTFNQNVSAKVLLVDDYDANLVIAGIYLDNFGYTYDVAKNGLEAVECVKNHPYAAVLMDIQMPCMDGVEASREIRRFEEKTGRHRMPIIALTAHVLSGDLETCLAAGMDEYITKPFNPAQLKAVLASCTGTSLKTHLVS